MVVASSLLATLVAGAFLALGPALSKQNRSSARSTESQAVIAAVSHLERLVIDLETGVRGFVITGQASFLDPWTTAKNDLAADVSQLQNLPLQPQQRDLAARIVADVDNYIRQYSDPVVALARQDRTLAQTPDITAEGKLRIDALRRQFDTLLDAERTIAATASSRAEAATHSAFAAAVVGLVGSVLLIVVFAGYLGRAIVRPVRRVAGMAQRLAAGDLAVRVPEQGVGEVGALERSFNAMACALQASRDELSQLLDQQAALRRVATLIARGSPSAEVFETVTSEVGELLRAQLTGLFRFESDGTASLVARGPATDDAPLGTRTPVEGNRMFASMLQRARPVRFDCVECFPEPYAARLREMEASTFVGAPVVVNGRAWGVMVAVWPKSTVVSEDTEARMGEFTDLVATAIANADSRAELSASRARLVTAADETRRRIERDLHDGIQQRLVSLGLQLRAAEANTPEGLDELQAQLTQAASSLSAAVQELQELSRGIHPAILSKGGLGPALRSLARRSSVPVELDLRVARPLSQAVEVAAYYVVSEALTNATKHSEASVVDVSLTTDDGALRLAVSDDGVGGADPARGSGLMGLRDRVDALSGTMEIASTVGTGTSLVVMIPIDQGGDDGARDDGARDDGAETTGG